MNPLHANLIHDLCEFLDLLRRMRSEQILVYAVGVDPRRARDLEHELDEWLEQLDVPPALPVYIEDRELEAA